MNTTLTTRMCYGQQGGNYKPQKEGSRSTDHATQLEALGLHGAMEAQDGARRNPDKRKQGNVSPTKVSPDQKKYRTTEDAPEEETAPLSGTGGNETGTTEQAGLSGSNPHTGRRSLPGARRALNDLSNFFKRIFRPSITEFREQIGSATERTIKNQCLKLEKAEDAMCELMCDLIEQIEEHISLPTEEQIAAPTRERIRQILWRIVNNHQNQLLKSIMVLESAKKKTTTKGMKKAIEKLGETGRELGFRLVSASERINADIAEESPERMGSPQTRKIKEALWELDMQFSNSVKPAIIEITTDLHTNTSRDVKEVITGLTDIGQDIGDAINRLKVKAVSSREGSDFQNAATQLRKIYLDRLKGAVIKIKQGTKKRNTRIELKEYTERLEEESGRLRKHIKELNKSIEESDSQSASATIIHAPQESAIPTQAESEETAYPHGETGGADGAAEQDIDAEPLERPSERIERPQIGRNPPYGGNISKNDGCTGIGITTKDLGEGLLKMRISLQAHIDERLDEMQQTIAELVAREIEKSRQWATTAEQAREKKRPREKKEITTKKMIVTELDCDVTMNQIKEAVIKRTYADARHCVRVESPKASNIRHGSSSAVYYVDDQTAVTLMREGVIEINEKPHKTYEFVTLPCCMNCQKICGHKTIDCKEPKQTETRCHRCAALGHRASQCPAPGPACYNCNTSGHPANSTNCPKYKRNLMEYLRQRSAMPENQRP